MRFKGVRHVQDSNHVAEFRPPARGGQFRGGCSGATKLASRANAGTVTQSAAKLKAASIDFLMPDFPYRCRDFSPEPQHIRKIERACKQWSEAADHSDRRKPSRCACCGINLSGVLRLGYI
jgi:hypothetical protein